MIDNLATLSLADLVQLQQDLGAEFARRAGAAFELPRVTPTAAQQKIRAAILKAITEQPGEMFFREKEITKHCSGSEKHNGETLRAMTQHAPLTFGGVTVRHLRRSGYEITVMATTLQELPRTGSTDGVTAIETRAHK